MRSSDDGARAIRVQIAQFIRKEKEKMSRILSKGEAYIASAKIQGKEIRTEFDDVVDAAKWVKSLECEGPKNEESNCDNSNNFDSVSACRESA